MDLSSASSPVLRSSIPSLNTSAVLATASSLAAWQWCQWRRVDWCRQATLYSSRLERILSSISSGVSVGGAASGLALSADILQARVRGPGLTYSRKGHGAWARRVWLTAPWLVQQVATAKQKEVSFSLFDLCQQAHGWVCEGRRLQAVVGALSGQGQGQGCTTNLQTCQTQGQRLPTIGH